MHDIIRIARLTFLLLILLVTRASTGSAQQIIRAPLRMPQAVVHGTDLQDYFRSVGEPIVPSTDQRNVGLLNSPTINDATFTLQVEIVANPDGLVTGIYNGYNANPALIPVLPSTATAGWFAVISFRVAPVRALVNLFDAGANFLGTTTHLGVDRQGIGCYVQGAGGTFYSQDARNPGGAPQLLFFAGTGGNVGGAWLAVQDQPVASGAGGDYDALILYLEAENTAGITPLQHSTWGELKSRFR